MPLENKKFDVESISSFVRKGEFYDKWDIVFATGEEKEANGNYYYINGSVPIPPIHRAFAYEKDENIVRIAKNNNRLLDPNIFNSGLTDEQVEEAKRIALERPSRTTTSKTTPIAKDYLAVKDRNPLLVILPIVLTQDPENKEDSDYSLSKKLIIDDFGSEHLIGVGIGFAGREGKVMMKFRINKVKRQEYLNKFEETEDEVLDD